MTLEVVVQGMHGDFYTVIADVVEDFEIQDLRAFAADNLELPHPIAAIIGAEALRRAEEKLVEKARDILETPAFDTRWERNNS